MAVCWRYINLLFLKFMSKKVVTIVILTLAVLVAAGFVWKKELKAHQLTITKVSPSLTSVTSKPVNEEIDMNTNHWEIYQLKTVGMEFKLPLQLSKNYEELREKVWLGTISG